MYKRTLTHARLLSLLTYDAATGVFSWRASRRGIKKDRSAGYVGTDGYVAICVDGALYKAHRLAWLYTYGAWPEDQLDHINGVRNDNRIDNLREATASSNQENLVHGHCDARVKSVGVTPHHNKYMARIVSNGKTHHLGYFETEATAAEAYAAAKLRLHTFNKPMVIEV